MFGWANWWDGSPLEHLVSLYAGQETQNLPAKNVSLPLEQAYATRPTLVHLNQRTTPFSKSKRAALFLHLRLFASFRVPLVQPTERPTGSSSTRGSLSLSHQDATTYYRTRQELPFKLHRPQSNLDDQSAIRQIKANAILSGCRAATVGRAKWWDGSPLEYLVRPFHTAL